MKQPRVISKNQALLVLSALGFLCANCNFVAAQGVSLSTQGAFPDDTLFRAIPTMRDIHGKLDTRSKTIGNEGPRPAQGKAASVAVDPSNSKDAAKKKRKTEIRKRPIAH
jgi:hypothetical protein